MARKIRYAGVGIVLGLATILAGVPAAAADDGSEGGGSGSCMFEVDVVLTDFASLIPVELVMDGMDASVAVYAREPGSDSAVETKAAMNCPGLVQMLADCALEMASDPEGFLGCVG